MFKKLISRMRGNNHQTDDGSLGEMTEIQEYVAEDLGVTRRDISPNALKIISQLQEAGYDSYLVGGCVRDLMIGKKPKDFDIATAAHPEQIDQLFSNCRLIGRRFRLAHIRYGREVIEVATFRGHHSSGPQDPQSNPRNSKGRSKGKQPSSKTSAQGMILRDNVYGSVDEDAVRRDFTINALYYDPYKEMNGSIGVVKDFINSIDDIQNRKIRMIGEPEVRYREDPVRMLRAVRFAAKLDFSIETQSNKAIHDLAPLLKDIPAARLFEEVQKLFMCGSALIAFQQLDEFKLLGILFPLTLPHYQNDEINRKLIHQALINTDLRLSEGKHVTPSFLLAVLLWAPMQHKKRNFIKGKELPEYQAIHQATHFVIQTQCRATSIPKRFSNPVREMWDMQGRLPKRQGPRADTLQEHPRFRASYDFLLLREQSGEIEPGLGQWWTDYQNANPQAKEKMAREATDQGPKRKRSSRKRKRSSGQSPD